VPVGVIGVLVGGDNIAAEIEQLAGDASNDARAIDARNQKNSPFRFGNWLFLFSLADTL